MSAQHRTASAYDQGLRIALISVSLSALLAVLKITGGRLAGSAALTTDGFESASDIVASGIVLGGMAIARRPPNERYPYGYGRAESLAARTVSLLLILFALGLGVRSMALIFNPAPPPALWALWPLALSIIIKSALAIWKGTAGRRLGSRALIADAWNDTIDIFSALVAAAAITLAVFGAGPVAAVADPLGSLAICGIILFLGLRLFRETSRDLMDVMPGADIVARVRDAAAGVTGVLAIEKSWGRRSGTQYFFDIHVIVDADMSVRDSHRIAHSVQQTICDAVPEVAGVLVHIEPDDEDPSGPVPALPPGP